MDANNRIVLPLNLQFFAEGNDADNPTANENVTNTDVTETKTETTPQVKTFTQEEVNKIDASTKEKTKNKIYKQLGITSDEELTALIEKVKGYDANAKELSELKAEKVKASYVAKIKESNVDEEYVELVYNALQPKEKETPEEFSKRVEEYIKNHQALCKQIQSTPTRTANSNFTYTGQSPKTEAGDLVSALNEKFGR